MGWIGPAISIGSQLLGGMSGSDAAGEAAGIQRQGAAEGLAEVRKLFAQGQEGLAPFLKTGTLGTERLRSLLGLGQNGTAARAAFTPMGLEEYSLANIGNYENSAQTRAGYQRYLEGNPATAATEAIADPEYGSLMRKFTQADIDADPVYQSGLKFGEQQGVDAINARNMANGTGYDSGATLKQLARYANDYGTTKASGAYDRFNNDQNNIYNRLAGVTSTGLGAANTGAASAAAAGNSAAELITGGANAGAAGVVGGANAWGNAMNGIGGVVNNYQSTQLLKQLLGGKTGGAPAWGTGMGSYDPMGGMA